MDKFTKVTKALENFCKEAEAKVNQINQVQGLPPVSFDELYKKLKEIKNKQE